MIIAFWIVAGVATVAFLAAGLMKVVRSRQTLQQSGMGWAEDFTDTGVTLIGVAEVAGAIGLVLPALTRVAPVLSPIAGLCLAVLMIGAVTVHVRRKEPFVAPLGLAVLALAAAALGLVALR